MHVASPKAMAHIPKPIPALYTVYVLRSTVRHASIYIGSTPNPPRRLKQHNGDVKGGASRTSRARLRPWEMITLVSGFPSMVAALKFEWALTNPHLSLHIPDDARLAISTQRKRNGMPKRPLYSLKSVMANIHLLTGVPSFARWPLNVHFFAREARAAWDHWLTSNNKVVREGLDILEDFGPPDVKSPESSKPNWGIHALPLDYASMKDCVEKANNIVSFEREGSCVHCHEALEPGKGLYPICTNEGCESIGHLACWSKYAQGALRNRDIIPLNCMCPLCGGQIRWGDMMKELTLRVKGKKDVEKLLKKRRGAKT